MATASYSRMPPGFRDGQGVHKEATADQNADVRAAAAEALKRIAAR